MFSLGDLRRYSDTTIAKVIIYALAASFFVGFGVISFSGQGGFTEGAVVAEVGGEPITNREVTVVHRRLYQNYQDQLGDQLTEDLLQQLNLRFQALSMLIDRTVLLKEAEARGLSVGDEELRKHLFDLPAFLNENGEFDKNRYRQILASQRPAVSPGEFEKQTREQLLVAKLESYIKSTVHIREDEMLRDFLLDSREVDLDFLRFDAADRESRIKVTRADIRDYYDTHLDEFRTGEQAALRLLQFAPANFFDQVEVTEDQLKIEYDAARGQYQTEEEVRASHILLKVAEDASQEEQDKVLDAAKALYDRAKSGEPFGDLAREFSEDKGSATGGGGLGWFGRGRMVKPFEDAAFGAKVGEIVGPVRTRFGYHILQVNDYQEAGITPYSEVRDEIEFGLRNAQAAILARSAAEGALQRYNNGTALDEALAGARGALPEQEVRIGSADAGNSEIADEIFAAVFGEDAVGDGNPAIVDTPLGPAIVIVTERSPSEPKPFEQVRDRIETKVAKDKALTVAAEQSADALDQLKAGTSIARVARQYKVDVENTGPFTVRETEIPLIGKNKEIRSAAFTLSKETPTPRSTFRIDNTYYVILLKSNTEPTPEDYQAEREVRRIETLEERQNEIWQQYVRSLRSRSQIDLKSPPAGTQNQG